MDTLHEIQKWYFSQCDGDWEHTYGLSLGTLDNPGWTLRIELQDTDLEDVPFNEVSDTEPEHEWYHCKKEGPILKAYCGPLMLDTVLKIFLEWAQNAEGERAV